MMNEYLYTAYCVPGTEPGPRKKIEHETIRVSTPGELARQ